MIYSGERFIGLLIMWAAITDFLAVGVVINLVQLFLYLTLKQINSKLYKKINSHLIYIVYSPAVAVCYYWSRVTINVRLPNKQAIEKALEPMLFLSILNHSYNLDWVISLLLGDQLGTMGQYKSVSKKEIKYLPVVGWTMTLANILFVSRSWKDDKKAMHRSIEEMLDYKRTGLGLFCEGTRWTPEKYQASLSYAQSKGIQPFKHHLIPRAKGFNYCISFFHKAHLDKRLKNPLRLYNVQCAFAKKPKFRNLIDGGPIHADVYIEEVEINEKVARSIEETSLDEAENNKVLTQFLFDIYRRKDEIAENYLNNNCQFSLETVPFPFKRKLTPLLITLAGIGIIVGSLVYACLFVVASAKPILITFAVVLLAGACLMLRIERETKTKFASNYGKIDNSK